MFIFFYFYQFLPVIPWLIYVEVCCTYACETGRSWGYELKLSFLQMLQLPVPGQSLLTEVDWHVTEI